MKDTRIPYGARCTWWDSIDKVGISGGLPCCPHCRNVLFEFPDELTWFRSVDKYEEAGHPGYRAMVEWGRGQCFPSVSAMHDAYMKRGRQ